MSEITIYGQSTALVADSIVDWATVHALADANNAALQFEGRVAGIYYTEGDDPTWAIARSVMQFDTSPLAGLEIQSLVMELSLRYPEDVRDVTVHVTDAGTIPGSYPFAVSDYSKVGFTSFGDAHYVTGDGDAWYPIPLDAAAISSLNLSGNTIFCGIEDNDLTDTEPAFDETKAHRTFWAQDDGGSDARLVVTIADPAPPEPPAPPAPPIDKTLYLDWTGSVPASKESRNWCPDWSTPATSMCLSRRPDGSLAILFGTCDNTGRILRLDSSLRNDDGEAIEAFYQTAYGGGSSGRNSVQKVTASVQGNGTLGISATMPDGVTSQPLRDLPLEDQPRGDAEWTTRVNAERVAWRFGTNELDGWFKMRKLAAWLRGAVWAKTRGTQT